MLLRDSDKQTAAENNTFVCGGKHMKIDRLADTQIS